ncbi:MAG: NAD-dependent epimerase/dehydratase family protein, partial [Actinomycetota bacterium]
VQIGATVVLVDSLVPEYGGNLFNVAGLEDKLTINISDIRDEHSMHYLVQGQDFVFNLAGQTSHLDSMTDPYTDLEINCRAQLSILEACRKNNATAKIVFASTRQIYGRAESLPVDEKQLLRPVDVNGINKMAGESYHILYNDVYKVRTTALRLTNTYGPRMRVKDARQTFLGIWIRRVLEKRPFEVWDGDQLRDFTFVEDAVDALLAAALTDEVNGRVFNLGGNRTVSLKELADLLISVNGEGSFELRSFPKARKRIDIGDYYADFSLISSVLGWAPRVTLEDGLASTLDYYRHTLQHYL